MPRSRKRQQPFAGAVRRKIMRFSGHGQWLTLASLAVMAALASPSLSAAETGHVRLKRHPPLRVDVAPAGRLYRQCVDHPVVEHRPSGDTVVPAFSCRWAVH